MAKRNRGLSERETEVLVLLVNGDLVADIAEKLSIMEKTVAAHKYNLMRKLKAHRLYDLMKYAYENGLAEPPGKYGQAMKKAGMLDWLLIADNLSLVYSDALASGKDVKKIAAGRYAKFLDNAIAP